MNNTMSDSDVSTSTFLMERVFDAPRETVWRAWTEPDLIARWFGPRGCKTRMLDYRLEPGGISHFEIRFGDGPPIFGRFVFEEIVALERIRWRHMFSDAAGGVTRHPEQTTWPLVLMTTVEFAEEGGKTRLRLSWAPVEATPEELATFRNGWGSAHAGWEGSFVMLDVLLGSASEADGPAARIAGNLTAVAAGDDQLVVTRRFAARREEVFAAFTRPALLEQWMLGPGTTWSLTCELDLRPGGTGRYDWTSDSGQKMGLTMTFVEIEEPARLVHREMFDDNWAGGEAVVVTDFADEADGSVVTMTITYASTEARDAVLGSPMAWGGMEAGYARLDSLLGGEAPAVSAVG